MAKIYNIGRQMGAALAYLRLQGWVEHFVPSLLSVFEMRFKSCCFIFLVSWYTDGRDLQYWSSNTCRTRLPASSRSVEHFVPSLLSVFEMGFKSCRFIFLRFMVHRWSRWLIGAVLAPLCPQDGTDHWSGGYFPPLASLFDTCFVRFSVVLAPLCPQDGSSAPCLCPCVPKTAQITSQEDIFLRWHRCLTLALSVFLRFPAP